MKTLNVRSTIILIMLYFAVIGSALADDKYKKEYHQDYQVSPNLLFEIKNKFGDIQIENWDKNTVSIDVTITVETGSQSKANAVFEKVMINFKQVDSMISAVTEIKDHIKNVNLSIDYKIKMPKTLRLDLMNSYGDVFIAELTGKSNIVVKYGNFKADKLLFGESKPRTFLTLAYSKGEIEECDWLKLKLDYSKMDIQKSEALIIKSKYSKIDIERSNSIVADSKFDEPYRVESVNNFVCTGEYSTYNIGKVKSKIDFDVKYSNIDVEEVGESFDEITIGIKYGHANLNINNNASYSLEADAEFGSVDIPDCDVQKKIVDKSESKISATYGKNRASKSKVKISTKFGNVELN